MSLDKRSLGSTNVSQLTESWQLAVNTICHQLIKPKPVAILVEV